MSACPLSLPPFSARLRPVSHAVRLALLSGLLLAGSVQAAQEATASGAALEPTQRYELAAGPLGRTVSEVAAAAGIALSFDPALTQGQHSPALSGSFTPQMALQRLLAGSGLVMVQTSAGRYTLQQRPVPAAATVEGETTLSEVRVQAQAVRDAATEGSGSYAAQGITLGKTVQGLRETAQSISVVTRQRMEDQNLTTVEDALRSVTGISAVSQGEGTAVFYSRGYTMNAQYDGVPAGRQIINGYKQLDTAVYDRIEVLRGPAGLLQGSGEPGGTVNLVRKGPLDQLQASVMLSAGSWNNHRSELDITGPLNEVGSLRGRMVLAAEDRDFHYRSAHNRQQLAYGTLDWDLTPSTMLSLTATHQKSKLTGRSAGLPTYADGSFLDVSRSASVGADWQRWEYPITELAAELTHKLGDDWRAKVSLRKRRTNFDSAYLESTAPLDPVSQTTDFSGRKTNWPVENQDIDMNISGPFELLGRQHRLTLGFNRSKVDIQGGYAWSYFSGMDLFNPSIAASDLAEGKPTFAERETQSGVYGSLQLKLADPLTLVVGGRMSRFLIDSQSIGDTSWSDYSKAHNEFTPYGGLIWDINDQVSAYMSYADIFVPQGDKDVNGQRLQPRVGWQTEAGIKAELMDRKLQASLAVFRMRDKNRSVTDPDGSHVCDTWNGACYVAAGLVQSQGIEGEINGKLASNWNLSAGYTYNTTKYLKDGNASNVGQPLLTYIPKHIFRLSTQYAFAPQDFGGLLQGWSVGGGISAQSRMYTQSSGVDIRQGGFATANLRVGYRFNRHLSAALSLNNLFDRRYVETLGTTASRNYFGTPRNVSLVLRASY
ncbi:TonB-dependent siderophore receptor [Comamonas sp. JUb58]|uniref:TonB-dependent siderophore receptor n=1 Tax=Comamonas sp. JUb58 TaxID=2485114 RepID=UPI0010DA8AA1|nr:TonB-dependent siderophore receptor [Comamonas sp. JUb58]TDS85023.1 outer membrane receptor for ferric coprogen and ferric-rhodotorulic acid [Comamonas sp. JUb58]